MVDRLSTALYGLIFFGFLTLAGCPPPATTKPEAASPSAQAPQAAVKERTAREAGESQKAPSSLEALRRGEVPTEGPLKNIYFDFDRYDLRADTRDTLKANAGWLKANPSARAEVEGHADERGTNEYNLALGAKRAQAAKDYLVTLGISTERLSTISYGEEVPVCREHNEECWQKNRRARFVIIAARPAS